MAKTAMLFFKEKQYALGPCHLFKETYVFLTASIA